MVKRRQRRRWAYGAHYVSARYVPQQNAEWLKGDTVNEAPGKDIDTLIKALYDSICGPAGKERKWDQMRPLFFDRAHMIRTDVLENGSPQAVIRDVEEYIASTKGFFDQQGFYEWEVARRTEIFGNVAHVFSTCEARFNPDDPKPFKRGINSIQLFHDGRRWWIINMLWDNERDDNPLSAKYLTTR
jgi:hypothetical protein